MYQNSKVDKIKFDSTLTFLIVHIKTQPSEEIVQKLG